MTLRELREFVNADYRDEVLDMDVSVKVEDEFYTLVGATHNDPDMDGILDPESLVLISLASNAVRNEYEDGTCPECGELIPLEMPDGGNCVCGHVLGYAKETDEKYFDLNDPTTWNQN